jgi:hypothetical protein
MQISITIIFNVSEDNPALSDFLGAFNLGRTPEFLRL